MEITLRAWKMDDLETLVGFANNPKIAANMTNQFPYPYTIEHGKNFIEKVSGDNPLQVFAITLDDLPIGATGIFPQQDIFTGNAELGYWIAEPYWGKGYATTAVKKMIDYGFKTWNLRRIFARPFGTNLASQKVLEKAGFLLEGKFHKTICKNGEYLDELVYAVRRS
jgi:RimJ/RimL family protein N-acetyltransferase